MFTPGTVVHGELLGGHEARPLLVLRPDSRDGASLHPPPPYPSPYRFPYCSLVRKNAPPPLFSSPYGSPYCSFTAPAFVAGM